MKKDFVVSIFLFTKIKGEVSLLLLHHKKLDKWLIPGGHIEYGEDPIEAAKREIEEETGLKNIKFVSFIHNDIRTYSDAKHILSPEYLFEEIIQPHKNDPLHKHIDMIYIAITDQCSISLNKDESNNIKWFTRVEIEQLDLFEMTYELAKTLFEKIGSTSLI